MTNLTETSEVNNQEFLVGDAVVLNEAFESDDDRLFFVDFADWDTNISVLSSEKYKDIRGYVWSKKSFRHATVAELQAKRRLTATEQALGEIS